MNEDTLKEYQCKTIVDAAFGLATLRLEHPGSFFEIFFNEDASNYIIVEFPKTTGVGYA